MDIAGSAALSEPEQGGRVRELVLHVEDVPRSTAFWSRALSQQPEVGQESTWASFALAPGVELLLVPARDGDVAGQVRLGLTPPGSAAAYVERLLELGARAVTSQAAPEDPVPGSTVVTSPDGVDLVVHRR